MVEEQERSEVDVRRVELFREFFTRYYSAATGYCVRRGLPEEDAREVASDAFNVVWLKIEHPDETTVPFLYRTCRNLLLHSIRSRQRREATQKSAVLENSRRESTYGANHDALWNAVLALPELQQEVIYLLYWDGLSASQTAEVLGSTESAVWAHSSRARRKMKLALKEKGVTIDD